MLKIFFFLFSLKFLYSDSTLYLVPTGSFITFVSSLIIFASSSIGSSGRIGLPYSSTSSSNSSISFSFFCGSEFGY